MIGNLINKIAESRFFRDSVYTILCMSTIFINFLEVNSGKYISLDNILFSSSLYLIAAILIYSLCRLIFKRGAFIAPFLILMLFSYASFCDGLSKEYFQFIELFSIPQSLLPLSIIYVFFVFIAVVLIRKLVFFEWFLVITKVFFVVIFFSQTFTFVFLGKKEGTTDHLNDIYSFGEIKRKKNVYFIMVDGCPGDRVLKESTGFQNTLTPALRAKGFFVSDNSYSNYHFTLGSVSSHFMADYHHNTFKSDRFRSSDFSQIICGRNPVVKTFKANGYDFIFAPSGIYSELEADSTYADDFVSRGANYDIVLAVLSRTFLRKFSHIINTHSYLEPRYIVESLQAQKTKNKPLFLYAHFMQIHDTVVTHDGAVKSGQVGILDGSEKSKKNLLSSIESFNQKLLNFVDYLTRVNPDSYIIICSDHGVFTPCSSLSPEENRALWNSGNILPSGNNIKNLAERFQNYFAIYAPTEAREFFSNRAKHSNVNMFRLLFSSMGVKNIDFLSDKHYVLLMEKNIYVQYPESEIVLKGDRNE